MEYMLLVIIGILLIVIFALCAKVYFLRKSAREITEGFRDRLAADTNTLIDLSSRDSCMRKLAAEINDQLRLLRKEHHRYRQGDLELKEAVTNISHDLRTPLTAICGYLDLIKKEPLSENAKRYLALIQNRTEAMKQLTEELFRYSMILSAGEPATEPVNINGVLEEAIAAFYAPLTQRGIQPKIQITEIPIVRQLNREALGRIFGNLIGNALKYSDGDLEITLRDSGEIVFSNAASGLDEITAGKLFDRFFTVETARNSTGLGLSISRTLAQQMGGALEAEWKDGRLHMLLCFP